MTEPMPPEPLCARVPVARHSGSDQLDWPELKVTKDGRVIVSDGFTITFFLRGLHRETSQEVEKAMRAYIGLVGLSSLSSYVDDNGDTPPLTEETVDLLVEDRLRRFSEESATLTLLGSDSEVSGYEFHYYGLCQPLPAWPDFRNYLYCWLPRSFAANHGIQRVAEFFDLLASILPSSFAYASPAFLYHHEIGAATTRAKRWQGLDVLLARSVGMEIGDRVAGVYWLMYLSAVQVATLGGVEAIRSSLPPEVGVAPSYFGSVRILIGVEPTGGDVNRRSNLHLFRAVARLLQPVLYMPNRNYFADVHNELDRPAMEEWHHRFLADGQ